MDHQAYFTWLNEIDNLSPEQRHETTRLLAGQPSLEAVVDLLEARVRRQRVCPHCTVKGMVVRGSANGLTPVLLQGMQAKRPTRSQEHRLPVCAIRTAGQNLPPL